MKKAFTLMEILIVIAIIGILASVVLVILSDARKKANDKKIMATARSIVSLVMIDGKISGINADYTKYRKGWHSGYNIDMEDDCEEDLYGWNLITDLKIKSNLIAACKSILKINQTAPSDPGYPGVGKFWVGVCDGGHGLTVTAWLPYKKKYYCAGTNGRTSSEETYNGRGCLSPAYPGEIYLCPGCGHDIKINP